MRAASCSFSEGAEVLYLRSTLLPKAVSGRGATVIDYAYPLPLKDHLGVGQNKLNKPEERFRATGYYSAST